MKILLIDDSTLSRNLLKKILGGSYAYLEASNGLQGLELYSLEKPDLVILDLTMPDMNGMDVLEKIQELNASARVIIGSADVQDYSRKQARNLGATAFIVKPFRPEEVLAAVQQVLAAGGNKEKPA